MHPQAHPKPRRPRAFTLVEIAAVILVVSILGAIAVTTGQAQKTRTEARAAETTLRSVESTLNSLAATSKSPAAAIDEALRSAPADLPSDVRLFADGTIDDVDGDGDVDDDDAVADPPRVLYLRADKDVCRALLVTNDGSRGPVTDADCATGEIDPADNTLTAAQRPGPPPPVPTGLSATGREESVRLSWLSGGPNVRVWVRADADADGDYDNDTWNAISTSSTATATLRDVAAGADHQYAISAYNQFGESARTGAVRADPLPQDAPPKAPTHLRVDPNKYSVALTWAVSASDDVSRVAVHRFAGTCDFDDATPEPDCSGPSIATVAGNVSSYDDGTVALDSDYTYWLVATDRGGNSSEPSRAASTSTSPPGAPQRPVGLAGRDMHGAIELSWRPPSDPTVSGFLIFRNGDRIARVGRTSTYLDDGSGSGTMEYGRIYEYEVRSVANERVSPPAGPISAKTTDNTPPADVAGFDAYLNADLGVSATWTAVATATSYDIWRRVDDPDGLQGTGWEPHGYATANQTSWTDPSPALGTTSYYRIRAVRDGMPSTNWTTDPTGVEVPDSAAPLPPSDLTTTNVERGVDLAWVASPDDGSDLAGHHVYRRPEGGSGWSQIATVGPTGATHTDDTATFGTTYEYRVTAHDAETPQNESTPTNVASGYALDATAPEPPSITRVERRPGRVVVYYEPSPSDDAVRYVATATPQTGDATASAAEDAADQGQVTLLLSDATTDWDISLVAHDRAYLDTGDNASVPATTTGRPYADGPLNAPANVAIEELNEELSVSWDPIATDLPDGDYWYVVVRDGDTYKDKLGTVTLSDTNVLWGQTYEYFVKAADRFGRESPLAGPVSGTPDDTIAPEPIRFADATGTGHADVDVTVTGSSPSDDVAEVRVSVLDGTTTVATHTWTDLANLTHTFTADDGLARATGYVARFVAVDRAGNVSGPLDVTFDSGDRTPPQAPTDLAAVSADGRIHLTWNHPGYGDVASFRVYLDDDPSSGTATPIATLAQPDGQGADTGDYLSPHLALYRATTWHVTAVDEHGNESVPVGDDVTVVPWSWAANVDHAPALSSTCGLGDLGGPQRVGSYLCHVGPSAQSNLAAPRSVAAHPDGTGTRPLLTASAIAGRVFAYEPAADATSVWIGAGEYPRTAATGPNRTHHALRYPDAVGHADDGRTVISDATEYVVVDDADAASRFAPTFNGQEATGTPFVHPYPYDPSRVLVANGRDLVVLDLNTGALLAPSETDPAKAAPGELTDFYATAMDTWVGYASGRDDDVWFVGTEDGLILRGRDRSPDNGHLTWEVVAGTSTWDAPARWQRDGTGTDARFRGITGVAVVDVDTLLVADGNTIRKVEFDTDLSSAYAPTVATLHGAHDVNGRDLTAGATRFSAVGNLEVDGTTVWFADADHGSVYRLDGVAADLSVLFDHDGDGLLTRDETDVHGTDPRNPDTDGDGISDGDEVHDHATYPLNADSDADGLSDGDEVHAHRTDPLDPDSDDDGLSDGDEVDVHGTEPTQPDSDVDGLRDGDELVVHGTDPTVADSDGDGISDGVEVDVHATYPLNADSDADGLADGDEIDAHATDPLDPDSDADGLSDGDEATVHATDPNQADTDADATWDGDEVAAGTDPNDPASCPDDGTGACVATTSATPAGTPTAPYAGDTAAPPPAGAPVPPYAYDPPADAPVGPGDLVRVVGGRSGTGDPAAVGDRIAANVGMVGGMAPAPGGYAYSRVGDGTVVDQHGTVLAAGLTEPGAITFSADAAGVRYPMFVVANDVEVWRVDAPGDAPVRVNPDGGYHPTAAGTTAANATFARVDGIHAVASGTNGATLYLADAGQHVVRVIDATTTATHSGTANQPGDDTASVGTATYRAPADVSVSPNGRYVAVASHGTATDAGFVTVFDTDSGTGRKLHASSRPTAVAVDDEGDVFVVDADATVTRYYPTGERYRAAGIAGNANAHDSDHATLAELDQPRFMAMTGTGRDRAIRLGGGRAATIWSLHLDSDLRAPRDLTATVDGTTHVLTWTNPEDAALFDVEVYANDHDGADGGGEWNRVATVMEAGTWTRQGAPAAASYLVVARTSDGYRVWSTVATAGTP